MSGEAVSALGGREVGGLARLAEAGLRGMITVRGDLEDAGLRAAVTGVTGTGFPDRRAAVIDGARGVLWMSPDEIMVLVPYAEAAEAETTLSEALKGVHALVADVSDARAVLSLSGEDARDVLARLTPADLRSASFGPGEVRRTRLAQVPAAFWMTGEDSFEIVCFRSVAVYVFDILANALRDTKPTGVF